MRRIKLLSIVLIAFLGIIVYSNTFYCAFQLDDDLSIVNNFFIRDLSNLHDIWAFWPSRFITYLSIAVNYHFHQLNLPGYHLFNLLVHIITALLVWWLIRLTLSTPVMITNRIARESDLIALLAGLVFVVHPVQTEAVTYVIQRAASMSSLFYLASLCCYIKARLSKQGEGARFYTGAMIMAVAAMFTKEIAITLPLMVLLYEFFFLRNGRGSNAKGPVLFLPLIFLIPLTMLLTRSFDLHGMHRAAEGPSGISPIHYLLTEFRVILTYIRLLFWPVGQNLDHDQRVLTGFFQWPVLAGFLSISIMLFFAKRLFLEYRLVSFSILWFFLTLLPESSIFPIRDVIFEHRLYLPAVGYSIFLVSGLYYVLGRRSIKMMTLILVMAIACFSVLTYQRNAVWKDNLSLWKDTVKMSPHKARPYNNLANVYLKQGNIKQALEDLNKSVELDPVYPEAFDSRCGAYIQQGDLVKAISDCNKSISLNPRNPKAYHNQGLIYEKQGNASMAVLNFNKAIELNPWYAEAYVDRGVVFGEKRHFIQAVLDLSRAIDLDPGNAEAYYNRAGTYYILKEYDKAWNDVHQAEGLGYAIQPWFITALKKISGTDK